MDGLASRELNSVVAALNFLKPMAEKPFSYNYEPPPGTPLRNGEPEAHAVKVYDARALGNALSLDREGFVLLRHRTAVRNFYDDAEVASVYYPETERLMQEATGAARVVAFDHITRNAAMAAIKGSGVKQPATRVHNDYTAKSAPQRVRDLMGAEAEDLLRRRFAVINAWRPISGPLLASPLALCDASTLADENLIASDLRYPDRTGEIYAITYNPEQRWYYFPKMQPDEVVLIRCFDSALHGPARFSAHGAFDDPQTPPDAPPRESIEVRTLVFFD
ncbi:MAG TPA: CmcJ/NvfI family oxidoreductase [Stellaceae bacterium]|nr:CmcJ/NvfI family oxidoreductase [Stellaceae bacterium]